MADLITSWLHAAAAVRSYREMFELAEAVVAARHASRRTRAAAQALLRTLRPVMDAPIAPSDVLKQARLLFDRLVGALQSQQHLHGLRSHG